MHRINMPFGPGCSVIAIVSSAAMATAPPDCNVAVARSQPNDEDTCRLTGRDTHARLLATSIMIERRKCGAGNQLSSSGTPMEVQCATETCGIHPGYLRRAYVRRLCARSKTDCRCMHPDHVSGGQRHRSNVMASTAPRAQVRSGSRRAAAPGSTCSSCAPAPGRRSPGARR